MSNNAADPSAHNAAYFGERSLYFYVVLGGEKSCGFHLALERYINMPFLTHLSESSYCNKKSRGKHLVNVLVKKNSFHKKAFLKKTKQKHH